MKGTGGRGDSAQADVPPGGSKLVPAHPSPLLPKPPCQVHTHAEELHCAGRCGVTGWHRPASTAEDGWRILEKGSGRSRRTVAEEERVQTQIRCRGELQEPATGCFQDDISPPFGHQEKFLYCSLRITSSSDSWFACDIPDVASEQQGNERTGLFLTLLLYDGLSKATHYLTLTRSGNSTMVFLYQPSSCSRSHLCPKISK